MINIDELEKFKGKKLIDVIKEVANLDRSIIFKVGANNGSGFFFVGDYAEFRLRIGDLSRASDDQARRALQGAVYSFYKFVDTINVECYAKECVRCVRDKAPVHFTEDGYNEYASAAFKKLDGKLDNIKKQKKRLDEFVKPHERIVQEILIANPIIEENAVIIYVDGMENGKYWDSKERGDGSPIGINTPKKKAPTMDDIFKGLDKPENEEE